MKFDHFLAVLRNRVLPDPVFIPLTIKYLLENGPTGTGVLYDHYIDFLERNGIPIYTGMTREGETVKACPSQPDLHHSQEEMYDLELINESIEDEIGALSLMLEDPDASEIFKDVEDFDGKGLLAVICQEKIDTYIELARQKKTKKRKIIRDIYIRAFERSLKDKSLDGEYAKAKKLFAEFLGKQLESWYKVDAAIVAKNQQAARKKISAKYGPAFDPYAGWDPESQAPNLRIFKMMDILIHSLRRFVQEVLRDEKDQDSKPWYTSDRYVPQAVLDRTNQVVRQRSEEKTTAKSGEEFFIMCMDEGGFFEVIQKNWKKFFKNAFGKDHQAILNHIGELKVIRDPNFHFLDLTADEQRRVVKKCEVYAVDILSYTERYAGR